ncbi:kinetochore scaffold 1 isoform X2 [Trematomus bernacchii]|uniref:kinetochore scaffold 1 isoform X2 n=1 Tax=Trematomus bernacchii TaxID=40690 RepID=UPI00146EA0B1|nr:kinetochore scaffold 1 isoform X2 [Trematomus bernacchii]
MEPLDPDRNEGGSGFSKRRISSILKAPRRSMRHSDPQQQEIVVECPKPVEKRVSRRVSFAPANGVLLFSRDEKNDSPVRSPLQELIPTSAATQNRVQLASTEDSKQHILGMETLLNAPLHAFQQTDEVNFEMDLMEKTILFSDNAFMDMTRSHTINIACDAELLENIPHQNYDVLPARGEKTFMFGARGASRDMTPSVPALLPTSINFNSSVEKSNISSAMPLLHPGYENFHANLSKISGPSVNPLTTRTTPAAGTSSEKGNISMAQMKTVCVEEENRVPTSAVKKKSLNTSRKIGDFSNGSAISPQDDISMDMTEAQTGRILRSTDDDDPFQCFFPTQEMYSQLENRVPQTAGKTKQQPISKTPASFNPKDMISGRNRSMPAQRHRVTLDTKDECRDKTIMFAASDEFMNMTPSHPVNIASGSLAHQKQNMERSPPDSASSMDERKRENTGVPGSSANAVDLGFKNFPSSVSKVGTPSDNPAIARMVLSSAASSRETVKANSSLSERKSYVGKENQSQMTSRSFGKSFNGGTICAENDGSMDMTEAQTGHITGPTGSDEPFQFIFPMYTNSESVKKREMTSGAKKSKVLGSSDRTGMETERNPVKFDNKEKTVRFNADDAWMDLTRSHTAKIDTNIQLQSQPNVDFLPARGEKTVRFNADDAWMDLTRSHTAKIDTNIQLQSQPNVDFLLACGEKTVRFNADDACMDLTRSHTAKIDTNIQLQSQPNVDFLPACGEKTVRFNADDACMDMTRSHTAKIDTNIQLQSQPNVDFLPACGEKTVRFNADDACMDMTRSHTAKIDTNIQLQSQPNVDFLPACGEKTVRFNADDACMDVTRSHTANIDTNIQLLSQPNVDFLPACGEKTVRFNADDACMEVTRSHTAKIDTNIQLQPQPNLDFLPACGEKSVRFNADDACMDVTRSHSVNIATDLKQQPHNNVDFLPACVQKTMRFSANDAAKDVTRSRTVNISTDFEPKSYQNVESLPACGEKTVKFNATDAAMDVTEFLAVNIASNSESDPHLPHRESNILSTNENSDFPLSAKKTQRPLRNRSAHVLDNGFKNTLSIKSGANAVNTGEVAAAAGLQETVNTNGPLGKQKPNVDTENEAPGYISALMEKPVNKTMTEDPQDDVSMDMTEAQTRSILGQTCTDEPPQCPQINEALGSSNSDGLEIINLPDSLDSKETYNWKEPEPINQTCTLPQKMESNPGAVVDAAPSRKSRRFSLADIQSKVRRLSHMMNTAPDTIALDSCTAPVPGLESEMDQNSMDKTTSLPVTEPEHEMGLLNTEENPQAQCLTQEEPYPTTPYNLKTKQLMSRLSVGGFKAKLPQRNKPDQKKESSAGEHTRTVNVTNQLSNFDDDVSDIFDEELGSFEDVSETLDMSPPKATEKESATQDLYMEELLQDNLFQQDLSSSVKSKKRPLPEEENNTRDEKRWMAYNEAATEGEKGLQSEVEECDGNITAAPSMTAYTTDYATSSHTASTRCEATFESSTASKQSLFESQLEDYTIERKLEDGTITVSEFFKVFYIDFVIHYHRRSSLPGRLQLDTDRTQMDLLKDKHINGPKMTVYETDVLNVTEMVEGLKERMQDLDRPLKIVNRVLWEEVRNASEEELKSWDAKLKERYNLFRKTSKVQSHEMKEVLYTELVLANLEEQQTLRGTIKEADEMIKSLDDCIHELQTELAAVEEKGFEDKPSLKSLQEDMQEATEALADKDRQIAELEMQKKQSSNKQNKLRTETRRLESHVSTLHLLNEWKFTERSDNSTIYTFLHETLHLQLLFEKPNGNDADKSERKISHITFNLQLDDEKSQDHARLVHKLLSQYVEGNADCVEKYPTSRHVPTLLHDVSLVVSRCRLLGEELRLLNMWGSMRLDILSISCVDTQVHIVFSRLKTFSKFEVIFSVSLIDCHCVLKVQSFKNMIGNTTIEPIEEIVASFSPAKNVLTKIVKKIHETLLC